MPKNYKTYSKPGSFSEFQIRVPDQTGKIEQQTKKRVAGLRRARQFEKENEEIYLRAQRLVNSAEDASRETNYKMQSLERQSYKDALDRDYKIRMDNLDAQNKSRQADLESISAFSQTAFEMVGDYMKQQEEKKVAAAHDVISRTGVTYDQMVAFQKMNDNLTRSEFAAQAVVQEMLGPDADPTLIDGMFAVYQNRNTKRWIEHKQLFQNSLNKFPEFLEQKIREKELQDQAKITNFDAFLSGVKREFMEINFVGKARPEVLAGAGVYAKLDELVGNRRNLFLKDRREIQKKELSQNRQDAFHVQFNELGVVGLIQANSMNPSAQTRTDLLEMLRSKSKVSGAYPLTEDDIDALLDFEGGGSNGQTLRKSFPSWAAEVALLKKDIANRDKAESEREEEARQREFDDALLAEADRVGLDRDGLTADEVKEFTNRLTLMPRFFGVSTDLSDDLMRMTSDAQRWDQTQQYNDVLWKSGRLTEEIVRSGHYKDSVTMRNWLNLAKDSSQQFSEASTKPYFARIENAFLEDPRIKGNRNAFGKFNDVTYDLQLAEYKRNWKKYTQEFALSDKEMTLGEAREKALQRVNLDIKETLENGLTDTGGIKKYQIKLGDKDDLIEQQKTGLAEMSKIGNILRENRYDPEKGYREVVMLMNHAEIEKAVTTFTNKQWTMPPVIQYIGEITNKNPLQVLEKIAPYIPDKKLQLNVAEFTEEQKKRFSDFVVTPYSSLRNRYRTPERTGRANIGDTKAGLKAPIRPTMFNVVQYVSGDPAIRGKTTADNRIVYDNGDGPEGHGGKNYHNHYEFATQDQAAAAKLLFEQNGFRVTSYLRPEDKDSAHSRGVAIDVAPDPNLPYTDAAEAEWSARANAVINFNPLENE